MSNTRKRAEYLGDPTLGRVMVRPRWIFALLLAFVVAGVFAWLGRWQLEAAIHNANNTIETEQVQLFTDLAEPGKAVTEVAAGAVVSLDGAFEPEDLTFVTPRENQGESGAWVVGHLRTDSSHLAVAIGWAPSLEEAQAAAVELQDSPLFERDQTLEGRYMPAEAGTTPAPTDDPQLMNAMVPGHVINSWQTVDAPTYAGYLVLHPDGVEDLLAEAGLNAIDSVPPETDASANLLNLFYALEWVVFAGFALFFWYRLARDNWEREHEMKLLVAAEAEAKAAQPAQQSGGQTATESQE